MKFFKKQRQNLLLLVIILATIYTAVYIKQQKLYENNPGLIPPKTNYDVTLDIADDQKQILEDNLKKYDDLIKDFVPSTGEMNLGSGLIATDLTANQPKSSWFLAKAKNLQYLGRYTEAIQTYNQLFEIYPNYNQGLVNLGGLYIDVKEPALAILQFTKLLQLSPSYEVFYYKQVASLYLDVGDPEQAGIWYIKYETNGGERDEQLMNQIKTMKEQQK